MSDATTALAAAQAAAASSFTASDAADFAAEKAVEVNTAKVAAQTAKTQAETARADAQAAAAAAGAQMWVAGEAVTTATVRQAPDGSRIRSTAARTTRATFDPTEQGFWTPVLSTAGTLEQVALSATIDGRTRTGKRPVGRDELRVSVLDYGVVGDGTTDDSTAFAAAAAAALAANRTLWIPRGLTVKLVTPEVDLRFIDLHFEGSVSIAQTSSYGIRIGDDSSTRTRRQAHISSVTNTSGGTPTYPSIRVTGLKNGDIYIGTCDYVQLWADVTTADSKACAYSTYRLGKITKLHLYGQNGVSWCNENLFIGGDLTNVVFEGSYNHNSNRFLKPCMESTSTIDLQVGANNFFDDVRAEGGPTVSFGANTFQNRVITSYISARIGRTPQATVSSDLGTENVVMSRADLGTRKATLFRIDRNSRMFDASAEFASSSTPVPGFKSLQVRAPSVEILNTGLIPLDASAATLPYESGNKIRRLLLSASTAMLRPFIYCYDANGAELDPRTTTRIELQSGLTAHATLNYYQWSSPQDSCPILIIDSTVKYVRVIVRSSLSAGSAFDWITLTAYVPPNSGDALVEAAKNAIRRPLYQAAAPTQGLAYAGENIGHATGRFTCTDRRDTTLSVAAVATNTTVTVTSATGMASGDLIGILLDDGKTHWTTINGAPAGNVVTLTVAMPSAAAIGNSVGTNRWVSIV